MRPAWRDHAACAAPEVQAQVWAGELFLLPKDLSSAARKVRRIVADSVAICATCPVLEQCRAWALDGEEDPCPSHVLAGMTPKQRHKLRTERLGLDSRGVRRPIDHGTAAGYQQHRRRGEQACWACTEANRVKVAAYAAKRRGTTAARMAMAQANRRRRGRAA